MRPPVDRVSLPFGDSGGESGGESRRVVLLPADMSKPGLGLSDEHRLLLRATYFGVVVHSAATVDHVLGQKEPLTYYVYLLYVSIYVLTICT